MQQENQFVMNPLHNYKETKHQQCLEAPRQSQKSTYQINLIAHIQNFEVLSTKYVSSSDFINTAIQMIGPKLDPLAPYYQTQV
jgi:hypothetical protein